MKSIKVALTLAYYCAGRILLFHLSNLKRERKEGNTKMALLLFLQNRTQNFHRVSLRFRFGRYKKSFEKFIPLSFPLFNSHPCLVLISDEKELFSARTFLIRFLPLFEFYFLFRHSLRDHHAERVMSQAILINSLIPMKLWKQMDSELFLELLSFSTDIRHCFLSVSTPNW